MFDKWDVKKEGILTKPQYLRLMQQVIGASKFARGPIFQRLFELSFDNVDKAKKGVINKKQFLICYNDMFANERRQMALLITKDFNGRKCFFLLSFYLSICIFFYFLIFSNFLFFSFFSFCFILLYFVFNLITAV